MKHSIVLVAFVILSQACQTQSLEKLTADNNHSTVGFAIPISGGITRVTGKFIDFDLKLNYVDKSLEKSAATFTIKVSSILTGIKERDAHLLEPMFFDAVNFPEIVFTSTRIVGSNGSFIIEGTLLMRGVKKTVSLPIELLASDGAILGIQIRCKLNRKDYGVGNNFKHTIVENFLGDEIDIEINIATRRDKRP